MKHLFFLSVFMGNFQETQPRNAQSIHYVLMQLKNHHKREAVLEQCHEFQTFKDSTIELLFYLNKKSIFLQIISHLILTQNNTIKKTLQTLSTAFAQCFQYQKNLRGQIRALAEKMCQTQSFGIRKVKSEAMYFQTNLERLYYVYLAHFQIMEM